jgi:hypothetical protein
VGPSRASNPAGVQLAEDGSWVNPFYVKCSPEAKERMLYSGAAE